MIVEGVGVVLGLAEQLAQSEMCIRIVGDTGDEYVEPLESSVRVVQQVVQAANLEDHGGAVRHNRVQLLEGLIREVRVCPYTRVSAGVRFVTSI